MINIMRTGIIYNVIQDYPVNGVRFIDFTPTIMDADIFDNIILKMHLQLEGVDFDYIIAPESRGFIWGTAIAHDRKVPLITARKKGKLPRPLVGASVEYRTEYSIDTLEIPVCDLTGKKVLFVDDVFATGGTYEVCKELVRQLGGSVVGGITVYDVGITHDEYIISLYKGDEL